MTKEIFEYQQYKVYLNDWIKEQPNRGYGLRSAIAEALHCQVAYVSQVLNANAHFNLEQAESLNRFLGHVKDESHFFLLLVQSARAGTVPLKEYFTDQIQQVLQRRVVLKDRLDVKKTLGLQDQATYYSAWYYSAVHVALSIETLQTKEALARYLGLSVGKTAEILKFLISVGLASQSEGGFKIGTTRIHLADDSPMISKHHSNWRIKAIESMDKSATDTDLHYSSVVTISNDDVLKIKSMLVRSISETKSVIRDSKEEQIYCFALDFFRLK